ncbi:MAG: cysteine desulfurase-like protein [Chloroflexi bacterium]|nr:cysteine desulfurase-like protein [Chloroflexota bacterium]
MTTPPPSFDVTALRSRFPALSLEQGGRPLVFLDGPGGTQVPNEVIEAVADYYRTMNANDGGAFVTSRRSDAMVAEAHAAVADLLGAASPDEIVFGANMTTLTFHVSRSIGALFGPGDEVVVTTLDHEANVSPWRQMAADRGLEVRVVDIQEADGTLDLDSLDAALGPRTRLVAVGYASNALGTINPVAEIVRRAHAVGALTWVDAVHYAPHGPIDVQALDTDFLVTSAYKWFGPHVGALYMRASVAAPMTPVKVRPSSHGYSTGTPNFEGIAGTLAAVRYLESVADAPGGRRERLVASMSAIATYERTLSARFLDGIATIPAVRTWGITDPSRLTERTPTFSISVDGVAPRHIAERLGDAGILAWDGHFYAQGLIERLGLAEQGGVVRLGFVHYTTPEEIDRTLDELETILAR